MTKRSLTTAVQAGRREALEAIRDRLATALRDVDDRYTAALAKQLGDVVRELDSLPVPKEASAVDDLAARRAARRSGSKGAVEPSAGEQRGKRGGRASS